MKARAVLVVAGSVLVAIALAVAATTTSQDFVSGPPQIGVEVSDRTVAQPTVPQFQRNRRQPPGAIKAPLALSIAFGVLVLASIAAIVGIVIARAIQAWRNRTPLRWRRERAEWHDDVVTHDAVLDPVVAVMAADAHAQRAALVRGTARNGIVECWLRLESAVADAGIPRRSSDTSTDLTERVLADSTVDPIAIEQLSSLYREARFSTHPMGEPERAAAVTALDSVHAGLRVRTTNRDRVAGPARATTAAS